MIKHGRLNALRCAPSSLSSLDSDVFICLCFLTNNTETAGQFAKRPLRPALTSHSSPDFGVCICLCFITNTKATIMKKKAGQFAKLPLASPSFQPGFWCLYLFLFHNKDKETIIKNKAGQFAKRPLASLSFQPGYMRSCYQGRGLWYESSREPVVYRNLYFFGFFTEVCIAWAF